MKSLGLEKFSAYHGKIWNDERSVGGELSGDQKTHIVLILGLRYSPGSWRVHSRNTCRGQAKTMQNCWVNASIACARIH
jgi:hypothetical protein